MRIKFCIIKPQHICKCVIHMEETIFLHSTKPSRITFSVLSENQYTGNGNLHMHYGFARHSSGTLLRLLATAKCSLRFYPGPTGFYYNYSQLLFILIGSKKPTDTLQG